MPKQNKTQYYWIVIIIAFVNSFGIGLTVFRLVDYFSWLNLVLTFLLGGSIAFGGWAFIRWEEKAAFLQQSRQDGVLILALSILFILAFWILNTRYSFSAPVDVYAEHRLVICPRIENGVGEVQYQIIEIYTLRNRLFSTEKHLFSEADLKHNQRGCSILQAPWDGPLYLVLDTKGNDTVRANLLFDQTRPEFGEPENGRLTQVLSGSKGNILGVGNQVLYYGSFVLMILLGGEIGIGLALLAYFILSRAFLESGENFAGTLPARLDGALKAFSEGYRQWLPAGFVLGLLILAAYGIYLTNNLIIGDDWSLIKNPTFQLSAVNKGRWLRSLMRAAFSQGFPMPSPTLTLALLGCLVSAWIQASVIGLRKKSSIFIYVAVFVLYPIWTEPLIFNLMRGTIFVCTILSALCAWLIVPVYESFQEKKYLRAALLLVISAFLFSLAASGGQNFVFIGVETFLLALLAKIVRARREAAPPFRTFSGQFITLGMVVGLGLVFYALEFVFSLNVFQIRETSTIYSTTGTLISSWADLVNSVNLFRKLLIQFLFEEQPFLPAFTKYVSLGFFTTIPVLFTYWLITGRRQSRRNKIFLGLNFAFFFFLLLIVPFGIVLIRQTDIIINYRYNAMLQLATLAAGSAALSIEFVQKYWWRRLYQALAFALIMVYAFQINKASMIIYYNNMRDFSIAERVVNRIELLPEYEQMENIRIIVIGFLNDQQGRIFGEEDAGKMWTLINSCPGIFNCQTIRIDEALWLFSSGNKEFLLEPYLLPRAEDMPLVTESLAERTMHPWPAETLSGY